MPVDQVLAWVDNWRMPAEWAMAAGRTWTDRVYPVLLAEIQHRSWVNQLVHAVAQGWVPPHTHLADAPACSFGHWYDTAAASSQEWAHSHEFVAIREPHDHLHALAHELDVLWRDGKLTEAQALISDVLATRDRVLAALSTFQYALGKPTVN
jgi:hypothetical protein